MYEKYWRLKEPPFEDGPDLRFAYGAEQSREGLARMLYTARQNKKGALLLGEAGVGKSFVKAQFVNQLASVGSFSLALISNPLAGIDAVLADIALQISGKLPVQSGCGAVLRELHEMFISRHSAGHHNLVLIDDADLIDDVRMLEQLRLLLDLHDGKGKGLVSMIFLARPGFRDLLAKTPSLDQRLVSRWVLSPFSRDQTRDYITFRLSVAGGNGWIIGDDAVDSIQDYTAGIAREINTVCDLALYLGMSENAVRVDAAMVDRIVRDRQGQPLQS